MYRVPVEVSQCASGSPLLLVPQARRADMGEFPATEDVGIT